MKVLVCIPCLMTGGTEIQTLSLVEALVASGHDVTVACYFEHTPQMVERYRNAGADVRLLSLDGSRPVGMKDTVRYLWRGLRQIVKSQCPDVAHVQYMAPGALPILMLKALRVPRIIATTHTPADIYSNTGRRLIRLLCHSCLDAFQCITLLAEKSYFGTSSLWNGQLRPHFTIYNSLPSHMSLAESSRDYNNKDFLTVGVVSRLEPIKGMDLVVPSFALAAKECPRLKLLVVGDGTQRNLMQQQANDAGLYGQVNFVGRKSQSELQDWYDMIDILLMPSRSEGFGLTAIEGMARGCVPIVSNTGGLPEVVINGAGILHERENITDIAKQIKRLYSDSELLSSLSAGALERAHVFSKDAYSNAIASLYNML